MDRYLTYKEIEQLTGKGRTSIQNWRKRVEEENLMTFEEKDIFRRDPLPNGNFKVSILESFVRSQFKLDSDFAYPKDSPLDHPNHYPTPSNTLIQQLQEKDEQIKKLLEINLALTHQNTDLIQQLKDKESIQTIQDIKESFTPIGTIIKDDTEVNPLENKKTPTEEEKQNDVLDEIKEEHDHKQQIMNKQQEGVKNAFTQNEKSGFADFEKEVRMSNLEWFKKYSKH